MTHLFRSALLMGLLVIDLQPTRAQGPADALRGPDVAPAHYAVIDDELFDIAANGGANIAKPPSATVDRNAPPGNAKVSRWERGVTPIPFDPSISTSPRAPFLQLC